MNPLRIIIFGNTNNYPLLLAQGLRSLGHRVTLIVNRKDLLHRPESLHPDWQRYPEWVRDCSYLQDEHVIFDTRDCDEVISLLSQNVDLVVLNDYGIAFAEHVKVPHVAFMTGSDLTYYGNYKLLRWRTEAQDPNYTRSATGRREIRRVSDFIARQRDGILSAELVSYAHPGLIPQGDELLQDIGVDQSRRMMLYLSNVSGISSQQPRANERLRLLSGCRIVFKPEVNPGLSDIDFKGTDILLKGVARFRQQGGEATLLLPRKGQDLGRAEELIDELKLSGCVEWLEEMSLHDFHKSVASVDLVCDQFGSSFPGMVCLDAYAMGRPVMAKLRPEVFSSIFGQPLPGFNAETVADIAAHLGKIELDRSLIETEGLRCRKFAEQHLSPEVMATNLLKRVFPTDEYDN